ncbi:membrane protein [Streptomyces sp. F-3]|uniref:FxsA family protein n=1 Tax=Streptomyces thermogriseus TaxID=75292 RepID=A0ABP4DR25_9ACTN|nr:MULTISPECIES: FxsA family membrane protein [Streptomyces]MDN5383749.1 FxsA family protein [Streptomyces sp. LB8]GAT84170.1 membrane protein [Streptomyces sp. F-3]
MTTGAPTPPRSFRPRHSRLRRYLPLGVAAWLVLEIWLLTLIAGATNGFTVLLLLAAGLVLGAAVIKRAGRRAFEELSETLQRGGVPSARRGSNGLTMLGGLLLMIPGVVSDAVGLLLLLSPVQRAVSGYAGRRLRTSAPGTLGDVFQQVRIHRPDGKVVQGEVIRKEPADDASQQQRPPLTR